MVEGNHTSFSQGTFHILKCDRNGNILSSVSYDYSNSFLVDSDMSCMTGDGYLVVPLTSSLYLGTRDFPSVDYYQINNVGY